MSPIPTIFRSHPNHLLAQMAPEAFDLIERNIGVVSFKQGVVLNEAGDHVEHVYFPHDGMVSLLAVMRNGKAIETSIIGREGVVGAMAGFGPYISLVRSVVQLPMNASRIGVGLFRQALTGSKIIEEICVSYNEILLGQARITAACNALHLIDARFCRWLLQSADRAESSTVPLTQELLSEMLGVRRTSVTEVAGRLQRNGTITFARGVIQIVDRTALEAQACECYEALIDQSAPLGRPLVA